MNLNDTKFIDAGEFLALSPRGQAKALGVLTYNGRPCGTCGETARYTSCRACRACVLERGRQKTDAIAQVRVEKAFAQFRRAITLLARRVRV